jgi:hypothetical protein
MGPGFFLAQKQEEPMAYDLHDALSDLSHDDLDALVHEFFARMERGLDIRDPFTRLYALIAVAGVDVLNAS